MLWHGKKPQKVEAERRLASRNQACDGGFKKKKKKHSTAEAERSLSRDPPSLAEPTRSPADESPCLAPVSPFLEISLHFKKSCKKLKPSDGWLQETKPATAASKKKKKKTLHGRGGKEFVEGPAFAR
jgi:hypothetical protein